MDLMSAGEIPGPVGMKGLHFQMVKGERLYAIVKRTPLKMEAMDNLNVKGLMVRNSNVLLHRMALYGAVCEVDFKRAQKKVT